MGSSRAIKGPGIGTLLLLGGVLLCTHFTSALAHTTSTGLATLTYRLTLLLSELPDEPARLFTAAMDGDTGSIERVAALLRQSRGTFVSIPSRA